ncbi:MAG TPA: DinB family protein [Anaerolineae bacterium]|nr:DinB family protein [Anaerolineae bacterium]
MSSRFTVEILLRQLDDAWRRLQDWQEGMTQAEFDWQPSQNIWHLVQKDGGWTIQYSWVPPQPAPLTTIGWRMAHLATSKALTLEYAFGERRKKLVDFDLPIDVVGMVGFLEQEHLALRMRLEALTDSELVTPRFTEWGEERTTERIITSAILHDIEHGAQIATMRELYRHLAHVPTQAQGMGLIDGKGESHGQKLH